MYVANYSDILDFFLFLLMSLSSALISFQGPLQLQNHGEGQGQVHGDYAKQCKKGEEN